MRQRIFKLCLSFFSLFCIQKNSGQTYVSIQNDNDLYFSKDYYYSNGLFLDYGYLSKKDPNSSYHFRLGQEIYNPSYRYLTNSNRYDYPYSGHLYVRVKHLKTYTKSAHRVQLTLGVSGNASGAKQLQNWFHTNFLNLKELAWIDAMPQKILVDLNYGYKREWAISENLNLGMDVEAQLGLVKSYIKHSTYLLINGLSLLAVDNPTKTSRSGFYFGAQQHYLFNDFMIQGPLDHSNTLKREIVPYRIIFVAGPVFYFNRLIIKGIWNYRSKDTSVQRHPWHPYMSISIGKLL